jgi:hypothetical protein
MKHLRGREREKAIDQNDGSLRDASVFQANRISEEFE